MTPLYFAATKGHGEILKTLLAAPGGVDVDAASKGTGTTPLLIAAYKGNEEVMRLLISAVGSGVRRRPLEHFKHACILFSRRSRKVIRGAPRQHSGIHKLYTRGDACVHITDVGGFVYQYTM